MLINTSTPSKMATAVTDRLARKPERTRVGVRARRSRAALGTPPPGRCASRSARRSRRRVGLARLLTGPPIHRPGDAAPWPAFDYMQGRYLRPRRSRTGIREYGLTL